MDIECELSHLFEILFCSHFKMGFSDLKFADFARGLVVFFNVKNSNNFIT